MHFLFAWRYFKAKKSTNVINIIAWICITAIVIGTAALIIVLSVFNGFEGLVKSLYASFYPDIKISAATGKIMNLDAHRLRTLDSIPGITRYSLVVEDKAVIQNGENQKIVFIKGVDSNYATTTKVPQHIADGRYDVGNADHPKLVMGAGIAAILGTRPGYNVDPLTIYVPRKDSSEQLDMSGSISNDTIHVSGTFMIQQDFDDKYVLTDINFLKAAMLLDSNQYTAIEIALTNEKDIESVKHRLAVLFGKDVTVQDRYQQNQSLYAVMNMERWVFYAVLCLILVVAAFNMVGALTMLVLEKQKDISVLNALGANQKFILRVFLYEGLLLALIGGGLGMLIALTLVLVQQHYHVIPLTGGSFLIDYFPVAIRPIDFILVAVTVFVIALLASWVPARKAAKREFSLRSE